LNETEQQQRSRTGNTSLLNGMTDRFRSVFRSFSPPKGGERTNGTVLMYNPITVPELIAKTEDVEWLIEGVLPKSGLLLLTGDGGVGKSWLMMEMALALDEGREWLGHFKTESARTLIIDQENSRSLLKERLNLLLGTKAQDSGVLFLPDEWILLDNQEQYRALDEMMTREKPQVVFMDSLVRFHARNENDSGDMAFINGLLKRLVRKHECALVVCHHNRKSGSSGSESGSFRGSSEIKAAVDNYFDVSKKSQTVKTITNPKSRYGEELSPFQVEIVSVDGGGVVVRYLGKASESGAMKVTDCTAWVRSYFSDGQEHSRQDVVDAARQKEYSQGVVDAALKSLCPSELSLRKVVNGHFYTLRPGAEDESIDEAPK
jgi:archaellum biogenesis ATPase FlaH